MTHYNIYGIGNAIVDYEVSVTDEDLKKLGIEKGIMTLIQENELADLMAYFGDRLHTRACGGSAANTIIGATQLGANCYYSCKVANDDSGRFYYHDLKQNKVDSNLELTHLKEGATGTCLVMITPDAERTMTTFLGTTATYSTNEITESALINSEAIYIEGYLAPSPSGKNAAIAARQLAQENGVKVAVTLSDPAMAEFFRADLSEMIGPAPIDILFCNEDEAKKFTQTDSLDAAKATLCSRAKQVAITLGANGALIIDNGIEHKIEAHKVVAIDSNGAGDGFAGAYLATIAKGGSPKEAGNEASAYSAKIVAKFGPRL
jgi:sugar/nucleoside kinase (ribokinase family)